MPRGTERPAIMLALAGVLLAIVRGAWWPALPKALPVALIALALGLLLIGILRRVRWHLGRRR